MSTTVATSRGASKPGPGLGPIAKTVSDSHRAWLNLMRTAYFDSGLSTEEISEKSRGAEGVKRLTSKGKVSELLRGAEEYPRWYRVVALYEVLSPSEPLPVIKKMWVAGALAAGRSVAWVNRCFADVRRDAGTSGTGDVQPIRPSGGGGNVMSLKSHVGLIVSAFLILCGSLAMLWLGGKGGEPTHHSDNLTACTTPDSCSNSTDNDLDLDLPTPGKTQGLLKITPQSSIRVYIFAPDSRPFALDLWIKAGDTFFVTCRTDSGLLKIAETGYYVKASALIRDGDTSHKDIEESPSCSTNPAGRTTSPYLDLPTPSKTQGLLKITPRADMPVSSVTSVGWIKADDAFFVTCRTDTYRLKIAETRYYAIPDGVYVYRSFFPNSWKDVEGLPLCTPLPKTSPSTR
ncbi:hypothetical protein [Streptomyces sp. BPTC-684]|uniref:hypothetical protein n=1 Tax=Streptomyces sp. BPTC-684 TaxID=3043734 RepID=UPI0024B1A61D|nr:hypothetical protein [Streptomyces sp. BPTC-684]WHM36278.1 hypothetical protein QIY60_04600 [Streptomyces sp. BPTC-684]